MNRDYTKYKEKHSAFWNMQDVESPLIGFTVGAGLDSWSYWQYNKAAQALYYGLGYELWDGVMVMGRDSERITRAPAHGERRILRRQWSRWYERGLDPPFTTKAGDRLDAAPALRDGGDA